jgi:copper chaperone CopZ
MKKKIGTVFGFIILLFVLLTSCSSGGKKTEASAADIKVTRIEVSISGMSCSSCEQAIQTKVAKIEGVKSVKALASVGKAFIEYSSSKTDTSKIRNAVGEAGFIVTGFAEMAPADTTR